MHNLEDRVNEWREELMTRHGLQAEKADMLIGRLHENLDDVADLDLSLSEKFALAKYRTRDVTNFGHGDIDNESADQAQHQHGLGALALMIGGYLFFGLFFSLLQFISIPLTSGSDLMRSSPDLAFVIYMISSAILVAGSIYGIWRFAQTDLIARLFGYRAQKPNSASIIAKSAGAVYLIYYVQQWIDKYAMDAMVMSGIIHSEAYREFNTTAMSYIGYTSLFLPTILFILLMWIQHVKYASRGRSADPTHA